jgi:hypothetical protein
VGPGFVPTGPIATEAVRPAEAARGLGGRRGRRLAPSGPLLAALAAALLLAACGGSGAPGQAGSFRHGSRASGRTEASAPGSTLATQPGSAGHHGSSSSATAASVTGPAPTAAGAGGGGSAPQASPTATAPTRQSSGSGTGAQGGGSPSSTGSAAPAPPTPGTYEMRQSGTTTVGTESASVPPQGTLVVEPPTADGTQVWERYVASGKPPSTTTLQFRPGGPVILATSQASPAGQVSCTFDPPIPAPPWPPRVGATFSAQGACGSFTVSVQGRIDATSSVVLDGTAYAVYVIDSKIATSGKVQATGSETDWYAPALRLDVHQVTTESGTYDFVPFKTTLTSDLVSPRPS